MSVVSVPRPRRPFEMPWLSVLLHRNKLDRDLALGADPVSSRALALRAGQLAGRRGRGRAATAVERVIQAADDGAARFSSAVPPNRAAICSNRAELLHLLGRLRGPEPVAANGVARLLRLLRDGTSPLYVPGAPYLLADELERVDRALSW
jgi:hypothetical protein